VRAAGLRTPPSKEPSPLALAHRPPAVVLSEAITLDATFLAHTFPLFVLWLSREKLSRRVRARERKSETNARWARSLSSRCALAPLGGLGLATRRRFVRYATRLCKLGEPLRVSVERELPRAAHAPPAQARSGGSTAVWRAGSAARELAELMCVCSGRAACTPKQSRLATLEVRTRELMKHALAAAFGAAKPRSALIESVPFPSSCAPPLAPPAPR